MIIRSSDGLREAKKSMDLTGGVWIARASVGTQSRRMCPLVAISNQPMTNGEDIPMIHPRMATGKVDGANGSSASHGIPHGQTHPMEIADIEQASEAILANFENCLEVHWILIIYLSCSRNVVVVMPIDDFFLSCKF